MERGAFTVLPESNLLLGPAVADNVRGRGLGKWAALRDNVLVDFLGICDAPTLSALSSVSKALYLLSGLESLWRDLVLFIADGRVLNFEKSWKHTFVVLATGKPARPAALSPCSYFSDDLFHLLLCCDFDLKRLCPGVLTHENIPRISARELTVEQFEHLFERCNRPVIITDAIDNWAARRWTVESLCINVKETQFRASSAQAALPCTMSLQSYCAYMRDTTDEVPFYLFDKDGCSAEKADGSHLSDDYEIPKYFSATHRPGTDLFRCLGARRPDHRWLVVGPRRSGSIYHIDPNQTHAWNAVLQGRKKWIFYPPHTNPPGVQQSRDGAEAVVPVSAAEWLLTFWAFHLERRHKGSALHPVYQDLPRDGRGHVSLSAMSGNDLQTHVLPERHEAPLECIQHPGDLIFVPHGYWHMVLNLDNCIALTHNYASVHNLPDVLRMLRENPDQVTGLGHTLRECTVVQPAPAASTGYGHVSDRLYSDLLQALPSLLGQDAVAAAELASHKQVVAHSCAGIAATKRKRGEEEGDAQDSERSNESSNKPFAEAAAPVAASSFSFSFPL